MSMRCRIIPLCRGVVSRSSLYIFISYVLSHDSNILAAYLFLFPASLSPSTVELILPSAPSTTVSQLLWISSHAALLLLLPPVSPPLVLDPAGPLTGPVDRVP